MLVLLLPEELVPALEALPVKIRTPTALICSNDKVHSLDDLNVYREKYVAAPVCNNTQ